MKRLKRTRGLAALVVSMMALMALTVGASSASAAASPVVRTFSFVGKANSRTSTLFNVDSLLMNARCNATGSPLIFAFSASNNADVFGRLFDGLGRLHIIRNSAFTKATKGIDVAPNVAGDFNSSGTLIYETVNSSGSNAKVVSVNYAFDNQTTLNHLKVCTVYGSVIAT